MGAKIYTYTKERFTIVLFMSEYSAPTVTVRRDCAVENLGPDGCVRTIAMAHGMMSYDCVRTCFVFESTGVFTCDFRG